MSDVIPYGVGQRIALGVRRVLARNPSAMTGRGTNSYLLGEGDVALIDPGPNDQDHLDAILAALDPGERISHIFVTHSHRDHTGLADAVRATTGAGIFAFGDHTAGHTPLMVALAEREMPVGGEGVDHEFRPDHMLKDGDVIRGPNWTLTAIHTPGHLGNHLCFMWNGAVFSGDHVMAATTSVVAPPFGDMAAYMASLARLASLRPARLWPGHGDCVDQPGERINALIEHRLMRRRAVLSQLQSGPHTATQIARIIYQDLAPGLLGAAALNVFAHLIELTERNEAIAQGDISFDARFSAR